MAIKFQYNKTSLQQLEKQLKMRERSLPTIKSKESALRIEVKRTKDEVRALELQLEQEIQSYDTMMALWNEFRPELIQVKDVTLSSKKIAGAWPVFIGTTKCVRLLLLALYTLPLGEKPRFVPLVKVSSSKSRDAFPA